jgi:solute:Na+ symporter, SSS family
MDQKRLLWMARTVAITFADMVEAYTLRSLQNETRIHQMVENAYKVTLA